MSQIPEGATHEGLGEIKFWVKDWVVGKSHWFCNARRGGGFHEWQKSPNADPGYPVSPIAKLWSGEGLPPVGLECETLWSSTTGEYMPVLIVAHDEDRAVVRFTAGARKGEYDSDRQHNDYGADLPIFRPILSAEQRAAEVRERQAEQLAFVMTGHRDRSKDCYLSLAKIILDAGYSPPAVQP